MKRLLLIPPLALAFAWFGPETAVRTSAGQGAQPGLARSASAQKVTPLAQARQGFKTKLFPRGLPAEPPPKPPGKVFRLVRYDAPAGKLSAYLTPDPGNGKKNPAIIWIAGGDSNSLDELWKEGPRGNEQTAAAYRKAGIVMMFPSLRGGNDNPGRRESFLGEVDDILAATDFLARQDYVDPSRIYLGGHSTGGTMAMLVAECSDRYRGVFSFGPADDVRGYGQDALQFDANDKNEAMLRSPGYWLGSVASPLYVFEGTEPPGNLNSLQSMARASTNPLAHFFPVKGFDHFSILAPVNEIIAAKILRDRGPKTNVTLSEAELASLRK